jgi:hypothetical protein
MNKKISAISLLFVFMLIEGFVANAQNSETPTKNELTLSTWQFERDDRIVISNNMHLEESGEISGYAHPNENRWAINGNKLIFYHEDGREATRFDTFTKDENGKWVISGPFLLDDKGTIHVLRQLPGTTLPLVKLEKYFNEEASDHFYETKEEDLNNIGYSHEQSDVYVFPANVDEKIRHDLRLVALHQYWNAEATDHFYETKLEDLTSIGYAYEGVACYVYPSGRSDSQIRNDVSNNRYDWPSNLRIVHFYRYWNGDATDHYYDVCDLDLSSIGYAREGVEGMVFVNQFLRCDNLYLG